MAKDTQKSREARQRFKIPEDYYFSGEYLLPMKQEGVLLFESLNSQVEVNKGLTTALFSNAANVIKK
jgi:hypothetical protein